MSSSRKWMWMTGLLVGCVICLVIAVLDLKNPRTEQFACHVVGTGEDVSIYLTRYPMLYHSGASHLYDVALSCKGMGMVLLNDTDAFQNGLDEGDPAVLTVKRYHFMPNVWRAYLYHPNASQTKNSEDSEKSILQDVPAAQ